MERRLVTTALLFGLLTLGVIGARGGLAVPFWGAPVAQAHAGTFYGANETWVATAATEWPQRGNNWCGPADIEVIANFTYQLLGGQYDTPFLTGGQQRIVNDLDSTTGVSEWGTPSWNGTGPGFKADIARDGGLDPRGMAWGILYESFAGLSNTPGFHPPGFS